MTERLYFVPLGDTAHSHPGGVCDSARRFRDQLLKRIDMEEGRFHKGVCTPCFSGMGFRQKNDKLKLGYAIGGCWISIKPIESKIQT